MHFEQNSLSRSSTAKDATDATRRRHRPRSADILVGFGAGARFGPTRMSALLRHARRSSRAATVFQERGQPCLRVSSPSSPARGQSCPRSFGSSSAALRSPRLGGFPGAAVCLRLHRAAPPPAPPGGRTSRWTATVSLPLNRVPLEPRNQQKTQLRHSSR